MKNPSKMLLLLMFASTVEASKIPLALEPTNARSLGSGYDSRTQTLKPVCVDNATDDGRKPVKEMEIPIGALSLRMQKDERAVADKLEISAKGKYKTGVTTAQASADFLNESKSNEFSLSYNYIADYTYVDTLEQSRAFPIRPLVGYDKIVKDSKAFFARCGDEYVRAISYAARLFVNINVSFVSKSQKNKFAADFSMNSPTLDLEAHAKQISTSFSARNVMTIQAIQYGGDPSKLGKVLCPGTVSVKTEKSKGEDENKVAEADLAEKTEADPNCVKASRVIVKCSFGDLSKCARVLELAISYANSQDGTNFPAQIAGGTAYAKISLETAPYRDLPPPFTIPPPPEEALAMKAARTRVSEIFDKQHELLVLAQKLYSGQAPRLSDEQKSKMEVLKNFHFKNVERAVEAVTDCYGIDRKLCSEAGDKLRDAIDPDKGLKKDGDVQQEQYDAIMALTDAETFVQYCDIGDDKFPEVRQTMLTLRAFVEENLKESNSVRGLTEGDFCANLASKLEELQVLDLSQISENPKLKNLLLGDLRPIGTLKNLKVLKLPKQNLMSVKPLAALKNLVELNLDGNYISDVSDLSSLEKLERLSVQNNRIDNKTMAVLGKLKLPQGRLVLIDARGNQFELTCPLPEKSNCKLLSFSSYTQIPSVATHCPSVIYHQAIALNSSQVLTVGGQVPSGQAAQMQVIDLNSGQCITKSPSKIPRIGHTLTLTPSGVMVVGGGHNVIEMIDPDNFEIKYLEETLKTGVQFHTATVLQDGRILIAGGRALSTNDSVESLSRWIQVVDPKGTVEVWEQPLITPRSNHSATLLKDGRVLIIGGYSQNRMVADAEILDPVTKTVTSTRDAMPLGRADHATLLFGNGHVAIIGGTTREAEKCGAEVCVKEKPVPEILVFDPSTEKFRVISERLDPARTKIQIVSTSDGRALLIGGFEKSEGWARKASTLIQVFDPASEGVYDTGNLLDPRVGFTATPVGKASVLVFGGKTSMKFESRDKDGKKPPEKTIEELKTSTEVITYRPR